MRTPRADVKSKIAEERPDRENNIFLLNPSNSVKKNHYR